MILSLLLLLATTINAQKSIQIGYNLNPIFSFTRSSLNNDHFYLKGKVNYSTGFSFSYFFSDKYAVSSGFALVKKGFAIYQSNFDGLATGFIKHKPIYHTLQIPLVMSYKQSLNDKLFLKYSCGITFDYNNFDTYKIKYSLNKTLDTLSSFGNYQFKYFYSNSFLASVKLESFYNETGSYEFGISYNHTFNKFPQLGILTSIGNSNQYSMTMQPRISYIGIDFYYSPYYGQSFKKAFSFKKPSIYLFLLQAILITGTIL